jgi:hypothetical protein
MGMLLPISGAVALIVVFAVFRRRRTPAPIRLSDLGSVSNHWLAVSRARHPDDPDR